MKKILLVTLSFFIFSSTYPQYENVAGSGGSGTYKPKVNPHNPNQIFTISDFGQVFVTEDRGVSWRIIPSSELTVTPNSEIQFTRSPDTLYSIHHKAEQFRNVPAASYDGGIHWEILPVDPSGGYVSSFFADPANTRRLLLASRDKIFYSEDAGQSYSEIAQFSEIFIGGVYWRGEEIYIGTNKGLLFSSDSGMSFQQKSISNFPMDYGILSMRGVEIQGQVQLYIIGRNKLSIKSDMLPNNYKVGGPIFYAINRDSSDNFQVLNLEIFPGYPFFVEASCVNPQLVYVAGSDNRGRPMIEKSTDGGSNWVSTFQYQQNLNIKTHFCGDGGTFDYPWAETSMGFGIDPNNPNMAIMGDFSFLHMTEDAGGTWKALYADHRDRNPVGMLTPKLKAYRSNGYNNTSSWGMFFPGNDNILIGYSDFSMGVSLDTGVSWITKPAGAIINSFYEFVEIHSSGRIYVATSTVHDYGQTTHISPSRIEPNGISGYGHLLKSDDGGQTWDIAYEFNLPMSSLAIDPNDENIMYVCLFSRANGGGIYKTNELWKGKNAIWTKLPDPPRTEGHPYQIKVLKDGSIVSSFTATFLRDSLRFTPSSGVFFSDNGGQSWQDRSDQNMHYYTKDIIIDPHDSTQSTWLAGVWTGYQNANQPFGGLYKSVNRGLTWDRIFEEYRVESATFHPCLEDVIYVSTEESGLFHSSTIREINPSFEKIEEFPFMHPTRMFFDPSQVGRSDSIYMWITSFGNGVYKGKVLSKTKTTSRGDEIYENILTLYPNPADNSIRIKESHYIQNPRRVRIDFYNLLGERILRSKVREDLSVQLDRNRLGAGVYTLKIYEGDVLKSIQKLLLR